jgi:hypothetical protein
MSGALVVVLASAIGNAVAYLSAFAEGDTPRWALWVFVLSTVSLLTAIIVLGARRSGRKLGVLTIPIGLVALILLGGFSAALLAGPVTAESRLFLGLPAGAAIVVYAIGLLPLVILPVAYALTFSAMTLTDADLDRVRAAGARSAAERDGTR